MAAPRKTTEKKAAPKKRAPRKQPAKKAKASSPANRPERGKAPGSTATQFKPGQSGNPSGRPRIIGEIRDLAREHTATAMETLITVMTSAEAPPAARVAAAAHMLDRGYGKPTQNINAAVRNAQKMTDDELVAFLTGIDQGHSGEGAAEEAGGQGLPN